MCPQFFNNFDMGHFTVTLKTIRGLLRNKTILHEIRQFYSKCDKNLKSDKNNCLILTKLSGFKT